MRSRWTFRFVFAVLLLAAPPLLADSLLLRGGSVVSGEYVGGGPDEVRLDTGGREQVFQRADIVALIFGDRQIDPGSLPLSGALDRLQLADGGTLDVWYAGGNENELRVRVQGLMRAYPLGDLREIRFGDPEAGQQSPPAAAAAAPPRAGGGTKKKPRRSGGNRFYFGGGLGASFGTLTYIQITPMIGYRVSPKVRAGLGLTYRYRKDDRWNNSQSTSDYGASLFSDYLLTRQLFLHGEFEHLSFEYFAASGATDRDNYDSLFVGPGFGQPLGGRSSFFVTALYNLLYDSGEIPRPYDSAWVIRVGFGMSF
jgi:hypothetical protein